MSKVKLLCNIPNENLFIACSGGIDSMFAVDFVLNGGRKPTLVYINHGTEHGAEAEVFVRARGAELGLPVSCHQIGRLSASESQEEGWRNERYRVFKGLPGAIVTAHHLDDALEWWMMSSMHGEGKLIPVRNENVIRPFLATARSDIKAWAEKKNVKYIDDPSNLSRKHMRNIVRHDIMPHALKVNPGLHKVIKKKYLNNYD